MALESVNNFAQRERNFVYCQAFLSGKSAGHARLMTPGVWCRVLAPEFGLQADFVLPLSLK
jgi:hypothetical protein